MTIESPADLEALRRIGGIVARVREAMLAAAQPGMTTAELDAVGERLLAEAGAQPAPRLVYGFPGATCISVNEEAAHGVPGARVLRTGDVLNVDVSAELGGYFADTGGTRVLPSASARDTRLCHAARTALAEAMKVARAGQPLNRIGAAIEATASRSSPPAAAWSRKPATAGPWSVRAATARRSTNTRWSSPATNRSC